LTEITEVSPSRTSSPRSVRVAFSFMRLLRFATGVDGPGNRAPEPFEMGTSLTGIDAVDIGVRFFIVSCGILEGDLDLHLVLGIFLGDIYRDRVEAFGSFV